VYLNESRGVNIMQRTWLEDERLREIENTRGHWLAVGSSSHENESVFNDGLVLVKDQPLDLLQKSLSGYAREMTASKASKLKGHDRGIRDGVGATERSGRWLMAFEFFFGISKLMLSWWASLTLKFMEKIGLQTRPQFLLWLARGRKTNRPKKAGEDNDPNALSFWLLNLDGTLQLPKDDNVDVEAEMRERLRTVQGHWGEAEETKLDSNLYSWFLNGGWWGSDDSSGSFVPEDTDDDITSVLSFTTDGEWESDDSREGGQRTPTQRSPQLSREPSPFVDTTLSSTDLAELLQPKTPEQRAEAHALAAHLASDRIMTRSKYRYLTQRERSKVLTSTRERPSDFVPAVASGKLTPEEEAQILEYLIVSRRTSTEAAGASTEQVSWVKGASGMGESGPQCVVCQCSPRSIIVWPCRCLSLCDDCRVTLAMNNFDKCVCCRRDVTSFSRIFVP